MKRDFIGKLVTAVRTYDLFIIVSLLWFFVQFLRYIFPPLFETFQSVYSVSNTETGILFTAIMLAYASVQFPAGVLGDKIGYPPVILLGTAVFTGASMIAAVASNFAYLLTAGILIGLGTGPHKTVSIPLLSDRYKNRTGRVLGLMDTVGQFGGMFAPLVVIVVLAIAFWQGVFILGAFGPFILVVSFYFLVQDDDTLTISYNSEISRNTTGEGLTDENYLSVFRNSQLLIFIIVSMIFTFAWNGISSFFPLFLSTEKGLATGTSGVLYSLLFVASLSQAVTGELSDRVGRLRIGILLFLLMFVSVMCLLFVEAVPILFFVTLLIGVGFHGFRPVRDSYLIDIIPEGIGGGTLGIIRTFMAGLGALAPAVVGFLSDTVGFVPAFGGIALSALAGSVLLLFSQRC